MLLVGWACARSLPKAPEAAPAAPVTSAAPESDDITTAQIEALTEHDAPAEASRAEAPPACPEGMVLLTRAQGGYCIDQYEASLMQREGDTLAPWPGNRAIDAQESSMIAVSRQGVKPQGYISAEQAAEACHNAGKRLCEVDEWVRACRGPDYTLYPYGNQRRANVCNDRYEKLDQHPVVRLFQANAPPGTDPKQMWYPSWMNDPRLHELSHSVTPTGAFPECTNAYGVFDMVGNLHEWVADEAGTFLGGFFMDTFQNGEGCEYRTRAHPVEYHDYSTGFRCCADPRPASEMHG